jgi:hypothetical protein
VGVAGEVAVAGDAVVAGDAGDVVGDVAGGGADGAVGLAPGFGFEFRGLSLAARAVEGDASVAKIATAESRIVIKIFFKVWCSRLDMIHLRATDRTSSYNDCVGKTPATTRRRAIRRMRLTGKKRAATCRALREHERDLRRVRVEAHVCRRDQLA